MSLSILGGKFKGRVLKSPPGKTRPTTSLVRKALFDMLQEEIVSSTFVDLFAGSGAIGLEALSRGAQFVYFSESDKPTFSVLLANLSSLGCQTSAKAFLTKAHLLLEKLEKEAILFDIVYVDPPYHIAANSASSYEAILAMLNGMHALKTGGLICVESDRSLKIASFIDNYPHLELIDSRSYSDSFLHRLRKRS